MRILYQFCISLRLTVKFSFNDSLVQRIQQKKSFLEFALHKYKNQQQKFYEFKKTWPGSLFRTHYMLRNG